MNGGLRVRMEADQHIRLQTCTGDIVLNADRWHLVNDAVEDLLYARKLRMEKGKRK
jgi:hypothetical protein